MSGKERKTYIQVFLVSISLILIQGHLFSMGKMEKVPVKPKQVEIQDKEFLKYSRFVDGEKTHTMYLVTIVNKNSHEILEYSEIVKAGDEMKIPSNYSNYQGYIIYSMTHNSINEIYYNTSNLDTQNMNVKIPSILDMKFDA